MTQKNRTGPPSHLVDSAYFKFVRDLEARKDPDSGPDADSGPGPGSGAAAQEEGENELLNDRLREWVDMLKREFPKVLQEYKTAAEAPRKRMKKKDRDPQSIALDARKKIFEELFPEDIKPDEGEKLLKFIHGYFDSKDEEEFENKCYIALFCLVPNSIYGRLMSKDWIEKWNDSRNATRDANKQNDENISGWKIYENLDRRVMDFQDKHLPMFKVSEKQQKCAVM